jgi:uncharacterized damage-inducible protein DinB
MSVDRTYIARNDTERTRLRALLARLSDTDLARPMPAGWTVAGVLAHLAFWDQRILALLERDLPSRSAAVPGLRDEDIDWINDAAKPLCLALAPRRAGDLAVAIADEVDGKVAALTEDFITRNAAAGGPINLDRAEHRREHLQDIEQRLGS